MQDSTRVGSAEPWRGGESHLTDAANLRRPNRGRGVGVQLGPKLTQLPMSSGTWAVSTDQAPDAPLPYGLYQLRETGRGSKGSEGEPTRQRYERRAALPIVHYPVIRRDGSGRRTGTDYLVSATPDSPRVIVDHQAVKSGTWADKLGVALSDDPKIVQAAGTAIRYLGEMATKTHGETETVPSIGGDGRVLIPTVETLPAGYLETGPLTRAEALRRWREVIAPIAAANPQFALALGASAVSPFVGYSQHADVAAYVFEMVGEPNAGKSTTMRAAGAIWGRTAKGSLGVVNPWNASPQAPGRIMGKLSILPVFFDEIGLAGYSAEQRKKVIYMIAEGPRVTADRGDGLRYTLPYSGVFFSGGNASLAAGLGAGDSAGINAKRINTFNGPFTSSAEQAESVPPVLRDAYGHPGRAILEVFSGPEVVTLLLEARQLIALPAGQVARSAAKNMQLNVAGAMILDRVLSTGRTITDSAVRAALAYLDANAADPEHDADRMLSALRDSIASERGRWPTVAEYRESGMPRPEWNQHGHREPGRIELPQHSIAPNLAGLRADDGTWFAVWGPPLEDFLARIGADKALALAEADRRGWLDIPPSVRKSHKFVTPVLGSRMIRFAISAEYDGDQDQAAEPGPAPSTSAELPPGCAECDSTLPVHGPECSRYPEWAALDQAETKPAVDPAPALCAECRTPLHPLLIAQGARYHHGCGLDPEPSTGPGSAVSGVRPVEVLTLPGDAPAAPFHHEVRGYLGDCAAARVTPTANGAVKAIPHHGLGQAAVIRGAFADLTGAAPGPVAEVEGARLVDLGQAPAETAPAPAETAPAPAEPGTFAAWRMPGTVTEMFRTAPELDSIIRPEPAKRPAPGRADDDRAARLEVPEPGELDAFAREVRLQHPEAADDDVAAALGIFHGLYGMRFIRSAAGTGLTSLQRDVAMYGSKVSPVERTAPVLEEIEAAGAVRHVSFTVPGHKLRPGQHFTGFDINGQYPAAAGSTLLGTGDPEVIEGPRTIEPYLSAAGYVLTSARVVTGHPAYGTIARGTWITMPHVKYIVNDLRKEIPAARLVYWMGTGKASKHMGTFAASYRRARKELDGRTDLPGVYARTVAKSIANKTIGMTRSERHNKTEYLLPDWYDQIVSTAEANMLRALDRIEKAGGGKPIGKCTDAAWWITTEPEGRPAGIQETDQLGKWKLGRHGLVTAEMIAAYRDKSPTELIKAVKDADDTDREV